jgi:hypothetical protein
MMKTARIVLLILLLGIGSLVPVGCSPGEDASAAPSPVADAAESVPADSLTEGQATAAGSVQVVYFHVAKPCECMAAVGQAIAYSIDTYFQTELASGLLSFVDVVSDDAANASAVESFGSQPFDLFFVTTIGDESSVEPDYDIWNLMGDDEAIAQHVKSLVEARLAGLTS